MAQWRTRRNLAWTRVRRRGGGSEHILSSIEEAKDVGQFLVSCIHLGDISTVYFGSGAAAWWVCCMKAFWMPRSLLWCHGLWRVGNCHGQHIGLWITNTVLLRPIVHGVWHMTAIVHWSRCSHLPVTNDNRKNCSCALWWPKMSWSGMADIPILRAIPRKLPRNFWNS